MQPLVQYFLTNLAILAAGLVILLYDRILLLGEEV